MFQFKLPDLGEGIHEGEILRWFVAPGDMIEEDAPLVDVETDKAAVTIPSPKRGRVVSIQGKVGDVVHVGDVIAVIDDAADGKNADSAPQSSPAPFTAAAEKKTVSDASPTVVAKTAPANGGPVPAAPATRRLARELGVELRLVPASGPAGRVTNEDVHRFVERGGSPSATSPAKTAVTDAVESPEDAPASDAPFAAAAIPFYQPEPLPDFSRFGPVVKEAVRSIRRKVAVKMVTSMTIIPHVSHMDDADVTLLDDERLARKDAIQKNAGVKLTLLPFIVKAAVMALKKFPAFNASIDPIAQEIIFKKFYNIGIACDSPKGLVVPVVRDADKKSVIELARAIGELAAKAHEDKLSAQDFAGSTFTITNIGPIGGTYSTPIINYPETAILAVFKTRETPVVRNGEIVIRKIMPLVTAFDHRAADGADAARFTNGIIELLADPFRLMTES